MNKYIRIESLKVNGGKVETEFSLSNDIKKYFLREDLYVEYDKNIEEVPKSILLIPAISSLITVAWMAGADLYVDELDEIYVNSINKVKSIVKDMYPELPLSELHVGKIVHNKFSNSNFGLLFSGGLDSMTSYIRNRNKKPHLIHCIVRKEHLGSNLDNLINFAQKEGVHLSIIRSNVYNIVNNLLIFAKFGLSWWPNIAHAMVYTGLCAPFSVEEGIGTLLIASSDSEKYDSGPWGSHPTLDNYIEWAGCKVCHDSYDLSRQEKIRCILKPYLTNMEDNDHILKALDLQCGLSPNNRTPAVCQECMQRGSGIKCIRNILGLSLEKINPTLCGFDMNANSFNFIKKCFLTGLCIKNKSLFSTTASSLGELSEMLYFRDMQDHMPEKIDIGLYNSNEFFEWFRNYDLNSYKPKVRPIEYSSLLLITLGIKLYPLYCNLPINDTQLQILKKIADFAYKKTRF
jgi:hypothetical protein